MEDSALRVFTVAKFHLHIHRSSYDHEVQLNMHLFALASEMPPEEEWKVLLTYRFCMLCSTVIWCLRLMNASYCPAWHSPDHSRAQALYNFDSSLNG